jgi:multiple sugar transport system permease protein
VAAGKQRPQSRYVPMGPLLGEHVQDTELMMAGSVLTVLPVIIVLVALQRFYIEGIMGGSVKE